jgi:uncharacterized protein YndB with AHSA1/START domain
MTQQHTEQVVFGQVVVEAPVPEVWKAWTTHRGAESFFAPQCMIDPRPGGAYEIYFDPQAKRGERGAEDMILLALQPERMLSFTWNAPPHLATVRGQMTHVVVRLEEVPGDRTRVSLCHDGWGEGGEWDQAFEYFQRAWLRVVLPRLRYRFAVGPVDWQNPPDLAAWQMEG